MQAFFHQQYKGCENVYFFCKGRTWRENPAKCWPLRWKPTSPTFPTFCWSTFRPSHIYISKWCYVYIYIYRYDVMYIYTYTFKYMFVVHRSFSSVFLAKNLARILCLRLKFRKLLVNKFQPGVQGILMNPCIKICGKVEKASRSPLLFGSLTSSCEDGSFATWQTNIGKKSIAYKKGYCAHR